MADEVADANEPKRGPKLNRQERAAVAQVVLARRLARVPVEDVCAELGLTRNQYNTILTVAHKQGLYDQARDFLLADLLPRALKVYAQALDAGDTEVARDVLRGAGVISDRGALVVDTGDGGAVTLTYERWRAERGTVVPANAPAVEAADPSRAPSASTELAQRRHGAIDAETAEESLPEGSDPGLPSPRLSDQVTEDGHRQGGWQPSPRPKE